MTIMREICPHFQDGHLLGSVGDTVMMEGVTRIESRRIGKELVVTPIRVNLEEEEEDGWLMVSY